jgi:NAD(P)-dependent dehydrogenase (short-subunit alcohol dehydrogenase family)
MAAIETRSTSQAFLLAVAGAISVGAAAALRQRPDQSFRGRVVVITGGSRGLGLAMARCFADEGAHLALLARSADQLRTAAASLASRGARVITVACDVRDRAAVTSAIDAVIRTFGRVDVLVNNAGVIQVTPFVHASPRDFENSIATHLWGPLHTINAALPHLVHARGRIVNIASVGGRVAIPHMAPYCVGKFALVGLSEALRAELAPYGVSVTTVSPFLMRTGSHRNVIVRGQHRKEAALFALGTATGLTAMSADRAARQIVHAARARRSHASPGWPSRLAALGQGLAPAIVSGIATLVTRVALPAPSRHADGSDGVESRQIDLGRLARTFASSAALKYNQRLARDEVRPY